MSTSSYKQWHKPLSEGQTRYKQGNFTISPQYLHKYIGDPELIVYRSSWEYKWCKYCCINPTILRWSSEPIAIKYVHPLKLRDLKLKAEKEKVNFNLQEAMARATSNYYPDFWMEVKKSDGGIKKVFVEIKPHSQTIRPTPPPAGAKRAQLMKYRKIAETYAVNQAKWNSAKKYAEDCSRALGIDCEFVVVTEKVIDKLKLQ